MSDKPVSSEYFRNLSERESYWILQSFISQGFIDVSLAFTAPKEREKVLERCLKTLVNLQTNQPLNDEEIASLVNNSVTNCRNTILSDDDFNWIDKNNDVMCYWAWLYVTKYPLLEPVPIQQVGPISTQAPQILANKPNDYGVPIGVSNPTNTSERIKEIKYKFDFTFPPSRVMKKQYLDSMKNNWSTCINLQKRYSWISSSNESQITWAWDNLPNHLRVIQQQPTSIKEQYLAIAGALLTWNQHYAELELIIDKAKRAWSQKKHRDSRGDKKAYSFVISDDAKSKLDSIAKLKNKKLSDTIEEIINNEIDRMKAIGIYIENA